MRTCRISDVVFRAREPGVWLDNKERFVLLYYAEYGMWELSTNNPDEEGLRPDELRAKAQTIWEIQQESPNLTLGEDR